MGPNRRAQERERAAARAAAEAKRAEAGAKRLVMRRSLSEGAWRRSRADEVIE